MSPTGEGAVSLSLEEVHVRRASSGGAVRGPGLGSHNVSSGLASPRAGFWLPAIVAALYPSCKLAPGKGVLRHSRELGLEVWVVKRQQFSKGKACG